MQMVIRAVLGGTCYWLSAECVSTQAQHVAIWACHARAAVAGHALGLACAGTPEHRGVTRQVAPQVDGAQQGPPCIGSWGPNKLNALKEVITHYSFDGDKPASGR